MGRPSRILIAVAAVAAAAAGIDRLYRGFLREWVLTWGATAEEAARSLPGDELLDPADIVATRALEDEIASARRASRDAQAWHGRDRHVPREAGLALRGERVALADGAQIVVRPVEPEDGADLAAGFERLGALSRFRLFGKRVDRLTRQQVVELTRVDHDSSEGLVALDAATGEGIAMARYDRVPGDPARAEVVCAVLDAWQHR